MSSSGSPGSSNERRCPIVSPRQADQIELVDMAPEALRRRMAHGNIYAADKVDAALGNYFRPGNLSALRELALLSVADRVDDSLAKYRERHGVTKPWEDTSSAIVVPCPAHRPASRLSAEGHGSPSGPTAS